VCLLKINYCPKISIFFGFKISFNIIFWRNICLKIMLNKELILLLFQTYSYPCFFLGYIRNFLWSLFYIKKKYKSTSQGFPLPSGLGYVHRDSSGISINNYLRFSHCPRFQPRVTHYKHILSPTVSTVSYSRIKRMNN
jgi:hypothetical protein